MIQQLSEAIVKNKLVEFQKILSETTPLKSEIETLYNLAIQHQNISMLNILWGKYKIDLQKLFIAASVSNNPGALKCLLDLKETNDKALVDINQKDGWGYSAILSAIESNSVLSIKCLLLHGATIDEETLCRVLTTVKNEKLSSEFLNRATENQLPINWSEVLMAALSNKNISSVTIDFILKQGAKTDFVNKDKKTPLMLAAQRENPGILMLLLNNGAQKTINYVSKHGYTALVYAAQNNAEFSSKILIRYGAEVNNHGKTKSPLMHATMQGNAKLAIFLIEKGANTDYTYERKNCLFMAIESKCALTVEALIEKNRKLLTSSYDGTTAIQHAKSCKAIEVGKYLFDQGAAIDLTTKLSPCKNSIEHEILNYRKPTSRQFSTFRKGSEKAMRPLSNPNSVRPPLTPGFQLMRYGRGRMGTPLTLGCRILNRLR